MRPIIPLCLLTTVLIGCASTRSSVPAPTPSLPIQQLEMIPEDRRPDLTGIVEIAPSYGHWGLEGWLLYLQPHAASTPGLCDLPVRYVEAPGMRPLKPNNPDEVKTGLRWAILDRPLSGSAQDKACRNITAPSLNVAWFAPDGEAQVAAGASVLRNFIRLARQNSEAFRASLICVPETCVRQRSNARRITVSMVVGMSRLPPSENTPYPQWFFRIDDRSAKEAGLEWKHGWPGGSPVLTVPENPMPGRRISLYRAP